MAPLSAEVMPITSRSPPHLGPACPQVHSPWFKLFLYHITGSGPPSLLLARGKQFINYTESYNLFKIVLLKMFSLIYKGTRVTKLPAILHDCDRVLVTSWGHDPTVIPITNLLFALNDALCYAPVLAQVVSHY
jgi:hypothetical protein